tara:strand:- start:230 stop:661 length:432 start_codon:yes stop_codon:yes gene_type:complete
MFSIPIQRFEDDRKDVIDAYFNKTPRDIMKFFGTDVGQYKLEEFLPGLQRCFWINHLITHVMQVDTNYVISDYRFDHEYDALKKAFPLHKIVVIKIIPMFVGFTAPTVHESEYSLVADYTVFNRDLKKLFIDIDKIMNEIKPI